MLTQKGIKVSVVTEAAARVYDNLPKNTNNYGI